MRFCIIKKCFEGVRGLEIQSMKQVVDLLSKSTHMIKHAFHPKQRQSLSPAYHNYANYTYLTRCYSLDPFVNDLNHEKEPLHHNVTTCLEIKCSFLSFLDLERYFLRKVFLVLDETIRIMVYLGRLRPQPEDK